MITVGMYYDVRPGKQQEFVATFDKVIDVLAGMPGHKESYLYQQVRKPNSYAVISEWDDASAFDSFVQSEAFRNVAHLGRTEILEARPRHRVFGTGEERR